MIFVALETARGFLWRCGFNSGSDKKSAVYMSELIEWYANETALSGAFVPHIFASMQDNTASVVKAGRLVEKNCHVVWLNCTLHMVALISTNIFNRVPYAAALLAQLETLTSYVRIRPRVSNMLKTLVAETESAKRHANPDAKCTKATTLLRVIPTRMLTARACFLRVVVFEESLRKLFSKNGKLKDYYYEDLDVAGRTEFDAIAAIAKDDDFYHGAQFMVEVLTPVLQMLRFLDRQSSLSRDTYKLMRFASDSVAVVLGRKKFQTVPSVKNKMIILDVVADVWARHQCPGHLASWFLNPRERETIVRIALSHDDEQGEYIRAKAGERETIVRIALSHDDDQDEYIRAKADTLHVIETIIRRMGRFDSKLDVERAIDQADVQLLQYVMDPKSGGFSLQAIEALSPEAWWAAQGNKILCRVARITQVWPAGTGNLERSMKINALVHNKHRGGLSLDNADTLVRGYVAQVAVGLKPLWDDEKIAKFWDTFSNLSEDEEADVDRWHALLGRYNRTVAATIVTGEARPEQKSAMPSAEAYVSDDEKEESLPIHEEAVEAEDELEVAQEEPRRSKRSPGLSRRFREMVAALKE